MAAERQQQTGLSIRRSSGIEFVGHALDRLDPQATCNNLVIVAKQCPMAMSAILTIAEATLVGEALTPVPFE